MLCLRSRKGEAGVKKSRFSEEQIIRCLKEAEAGKPISQICREQGVADVTFYRWREKYGGMEVGDARRLKQVEEENRKLKHLLADAMLDNKVLKDLLGKKF